MTYLLIRILYRTQLLFLIETKTLTKTLSSTPERQAHLYSQIQTYLSETGVNTKQPYWKLTQDMRMDGTTAKIEEIFL